MWFIFIYIYISILYLFAIVGDNILLELILKKTKNNHFSIPVWYLSS